MRVAAGLALLALAVSTKLAAGPVAGMVAGLLSGLFLAHSARGNAPEKTGGFLRVAAAALVAALLAFSLRAFGAPFPLPGAARLAWFFPALAAAAFALRVPAEAPNAPASGASARARAWRRHAPDLAAAALLLPFAAVFATGVPLLSLPAFALVLGVLLSRLARPAAPLLLSALLLSLLLPDPASFAFGLLSGGLSGGARLW